MSFGALIFDCDGVLVDTERDGHLVAFNQAFADLGIAAHWDEALYDRLLQTGGGKERMTAYFDEFGWPAGHEDKQRLIARLHKRKSEIFLDLIDQGKLMLRPGIARIIDEAISAGLKLAVCSTSRLNLFKAAWRLPGLSASPGSIGCWPETLSTTRNRIPRSTTWRALNWAFRQRPASLSKTARSVAAPRLPPECALSSR